MLKDNPLHHNFKIISDKTELQNIEKDWDQLAESFKHPFLSFDWYYSTIETFYNDENIFIIITFNENEITGIAPLIKKAGKFFNHLEIAGYNNHYEPCSILYKDEEARNYLVKCLIDLKIPIVLNRIPEDQKVYTDFKKNIKFPDFTIIRRGSKSGVVNIKSNWSQRYEEFSSQRRYQYHRISKKLEKQGNLKIESVTPEFDQFEYYFKEFMRIEASGWKGRLNTALQYQPTLVEFYKNFAKKACQDKSIRFFVLSLSGENIAMVMNIEKFDVLWELKIGYDDQWSKFSPGTLLTFEIIKYAYQNNLKAYEFLGSLEEWQLFWVNHIKEYAFITFYPFNIGGIYKFSIDILKYFNNHVINYFKH